MAEIIKFKNNRDYRRMYRLGNSFVSPLLVIYVMKNKTGNVRYGITTGKKTGNAVKRNRARRIIRAAFYSVAGNIPSGFDFIFVSRTKTAYMKSTDLANCMNKQLKKAGVLL